jgi:putative oxidoreductase
MDFNGHYHYYAAALAARIFLGVLFFFQGYDAVFRVKIKNVIKTFESGFSQNGIPSTFTVAASWFTSFSALLGGALLIPGLFIYPALFLLSLNLIIAAIGFGINTPVWDTRHVFPRLVLVLFLLIVPELWHTFSIDYLITKF